MAGKDKDKDKGKDQDDDLDLEDAEDADDEDGEGKSKNDEDDEQEEPPSARVGYIGLGLMGSLIVGFDPLRDAAVGNGSFESAVLRFLACVAVCTVGAGTLGRLIDASAPPFTNAGPTSSSGDDASNDATKTASGEPALADGGGVRPGLDQGEDGEVSQIGAPLETSEPTGRQDNSQGQPAAQEITR
ncbi:MAG: hypothetical protein AAF547_04255 [Actinomycetota bacterium]